MKKFIILCFIMLCICTGCGKEKVNNDKINNNPLEEVSDEKLRKINDKIIKYFSSENAKYDNLGFNYVDFENKRVIVGLLDNSNDKQEEFKKNVINSEYVVFVNAKGVNEYTEKAATLKLNCLENLLGGYITSEIVSPTEKSLSDIIEIDMKKVEYSKVKVTDNGWIYVVIKTSSNDIINALENYFKVNYNGYKKFKLDNIYDIYIYNGYDELDIYEEVKKCNKLQSKSM